MEVLASRILVRPSDPERSRRFYRDVLGLSVFREFGPADDPGLVFHAGGGFIEVAGRGEGATSPDVAVWLQVRDVAAEHDRLTALGVEVVRAPRTEPWGLVEMWLADPDGLRIAVVEVPTTHPLRRDPRGAGTDETGATA